MKLSIAIPTYNGAQTISETLDSIVTQLEDGVEIVVSDNASTDGTAEIVREYQLKYPVIHYFCNDENIGADRNFDLAVRRAKGEYVWLFGDDDKLASGGIRKVLSVLEDHVELAVVFVNYAVYSSDFKQCFEENVLVNRNDLYCENADNFLAAVNIAPIFMSSNIIRRTLWEQTNSMRYIGTNWIHYGTMLSLLPGHSSYCVVFPYVMLRAGATRWKRDGILLLNGCELMKIISKLTSLGYSKKAVRRPINTMLQNLPFTIIGSKLEGLSMTQPLLKNLVKNYGSYPSFWIFDFTLLIFPRIFYQIAWNLYQIPFVKKVYKISNLWIKNRLIKN